MSDSLMIPQHELFRVAFHTLEMSLIFSKQFQRSLLSVVGLDHETQCLTTCLKQKNGRQSHLFLNVFLSGTIRNLVAVRRAEFLSSPVAEMATWFF